MISNFENLLEQLKEEYNEAIKDREYYHNALMEFNKDEEIQKLKDIIHNSYNIPGNLRKEMENLAHKHRDETKHNYWSYIITPTHVADCIECQCNKCSEILMRAWM